MAETQHKLDPIAGPDGGDKGKRLAKHWQEQIKKVDAEQKAWLKRGRSIERRYRDQRNRSDEEDQRRMNMLWANVQTFFPALYGKCPVPIAERRFKDRDPVGRSAASIIERALRNDHEFDDFHNSVSSAVMDYLLPGRAVVWVRYEPQFERGISIPVYGQNDLRDDQGDIEKEREDEEEEKLEDTDDRILRESCPVDYLSWEDAYFFPAKVRIWEQVRGVGKRLYMSYDDMVDFLMQVCGCSEEKAEEIADLIPLQKDDREKRDTAEGRATTDKRDDKAQWFEIWDMDRREVVWIADGCDFVIQRMDDPLGLENFFPVPRPLIANATNTTIVPVPDYIQYQDQARQIDELTQRISQLAKACKIAGLYDASVDELVRLLDESVENELLPVDNWRALSEKLNAQGGSPIWLLPIEQIVMALKELVEIRKMAIEDMDRITGLTDVMRGVTTDNRETLGKGKLNNNNGKTRLRQRQDDVADFCRDIIRIQAEIMCLHFSDDSLIDASGALYEEGLGVEDVMEIGTPSPQPMPGAAPSAGTSPQPGGLPALPPPGGERTPPPGGNVVPMRPGMPTPPMAPMPPPPDPYEEAIQRIAKAITLLRKDYQRGFRIDIETDSTIVGDEEADKQSRVEFIGMLGGMMKEALPMIQAQPTAAPLLIKAAQFAARGFRVGRDLESALEEFGDQIEKEVKAAQGQPKPPSPEMIKAQADAKRADTEAQKIGFEGQKAQAEMQSKQADAKNEMVKLHSEIQMKQAEIKIKEYELEIAKIKAMAEVQKAHIERETFQQDMVDRSQDRQMKGEAHQMAMAGQHQAMQHADQNMSLEHHKAGMEGEKHARDGEKHQREGESHNQEIRHKEHEHRVGAERDTKMDEVLTHLKAPKKVVRDKDGRISGLAAG